MENLFVFIIYKISCVWFIGQLLKEPPLSKHLFHCLSMPLYINPSKKVLSVIFECVHAYMEVLVFMCACSSACMCIQHMRYVLIRGKQTAVRLGRLVFLSECVYLNSPPSLLVLSSITCLEEATCSHVLHAQTHALTLVLKIGWYDCMGALSVPLSHVYAFLPLFGSKIFS